MGVRAERWDVLPGACARRWESAVKGIATRCGCNEDGTSDKYGNRFWGTSLLVFVRVDG